jgi:hypothetical protein
MFAPFYLFLVQANTRSIPARPLLTAPSSSGPNAPRAFSQMDRAIPEIEGVAVPMKDQGETAGSAAAAMSTAHVNGNETVNESINGTYTVRRILKPAIRCGCLVAPSSTAPAMSKPP